MIKVVNKRTGITHVVPASHFSVNDPGYEVLGAVTAVAPDLNANFNWESVEVEDATDEQLDAYIETAGVQTAATTREGKIKAIEKHIAKADQQED